MFATHHGKKAYIPKVEELKKRSNNILINTNWKDTEDGPTRCIHLLLMKNLHIDDLFSQLL